MHSNRLVYIFSLLLAVSGCSGIDVGGTCGDGNVDLTEFCDDGNTTDGDGCSADCQSDETCGNFVVDAPTGEECDDGNLLSGDGCQETCMTPTCGDGFIDVGERCDGDPGCNSSCDGYFASCAEILASDSMATDGLYAIDPDASGTTLPAMCDMTTDGGGWTLTLKVQGGSAVQPWFSASLIGDDTSLPTTLDAPLVLSEGPSMADRSAITMAIGATEYRSTLYDGMDELVIDVASTYTGTAGRGLRCFASGEPDCMNLAQDCSPSNTDARVISSNGSSNYADGDTGHLCDIGWWDCGFCVDWSWISKTGSLGSVSADDVIFVADDAHTSSSDYSLFWIR